MKKKIISIVSVFAVAISILILFAYYLSTRGNQELDTIPMSCKDREYQAPNINVKTPEIKGRLSYPVVITDSKGHQVRISHPPKRIVVTGSEPANCIIFLGKGDHVIGRLANHKQPELVHAKVVSAGSLASNYEALAAMKPDLVLLDLHAYEETARMCDKYEIPHFAFKIRKIEEMPKMYELFAKLLDAEPSKLKELENLLERLNRVEERTNDLKLEERPNVFVEFQYRPSLRALVGANSITADIIWKAGGQIFPRCGSFAAPISVEWLMKNPPDWYIVGQGFFGGTTSLEDVKKRPMIGKLRCIIENRVLLVDSLSYIQSHPKTIENIIELTKKLHPDRMKDFK